METSFHCSVPGLRNAFRFLWIALLTSAVVLIHGYHPWAEDGGLYVAGIEYILDPSLFPHDTAFVTEHLHFSIFAPLLAALVHLCHCSLATVLFGAYLSTTSLSLLAARRIVVQCSSSEPARWTGIALFAAAWTTPVAGTSLLLMDPYLTARSFSTPLSLLAIAAALEAHSSTTYSFHPIHSRPAFYNPHLQCIAFLLLAAAFHPLMAGYTVPLVIAIHLGAKRASKWCWVALTAATLLLALTVQAAAAPESAAVISAAHSRFYWFLSHWHWYERFGLVGPSLVLVLLSRLQSSSRLNSIQILSRACTAIALLSTTVAILFAQEHLRAHAVARLQPLRAFLPIYALMFVLLGASLVPLLAKLQASFPPIPAAARILSAPLLILLVAAGMALVQRRSFPASPHIELPGKVNPNPWVQASLWARDHTSSDAFFALDALYINTHGEDAQVFRAISLRSAIADFSKDGGEAAISPSLASHWLREATASTGLSQLSDRSRDASLRPFGVTWVVLHAGTPTAHACPYRNQIVQLCTLSDAHPASHAGNLPASIAHATALASPNGQSRPPAPHGASTLRRTASIHSRHSRSAAAARPA